MAPHRDPWLGLGLHTPARLALGRAGSALPTSEVLAFAAAHARARDAVHAPFDAAGLVAALDKAGLPASRVASAATSRSVYLRRPDLGRRLDAPSRQRLCGCDAVAADLTVVLADGLSATAVHAHGLAMVEALLPGLRAAGVLLGPTVVAEGARVAIGDEIGATLRARAVLVLIGERPGLSSPDSLGAYLTFAPMVGRSDAERNCVSNIRPEGLPYATAAGRLVWLIREAFRRGLTGVALKDESDAALAASEMAVIPRLP